MKTVKMNVTFPVEFQQEYDDAGRPLHPLRMFAECFDDYFLDLQNYTRAWRINRDIDYEVYEAYAGEKWPERMAEGERRANEHRERLAERQRETDENLDRNCPAALGISGAEWRKMNWNEQYKLIKEKCVWHDGYGYFQQGNP